jgi:hypothetical protein
VTRAGEVALALAEPGGRTIAALRAWLRAVTDEAEAVEAIDAGHLVVTPLGLAARPWLEARLAAMGVVPRERLPLPAWSRVATAIRVRDPEADAERLRTAALFEAAWRALFPADRAEAWALRSAEDRLRVARAKPALRAQLRLLSVDFGLGPTCARLLTPFHLADAGDAPLEGRRLLAAQRLLARGLPARAVWRAA